MPDVRGIPKVARRSTILTSQLPVAQWHEQIYDPTLADSILDRLVLSGTVSKVGAGAPLVVSEPFGQIIRIGRFRWNSEFGWRRVWQAAS
jgi:hypothetical protein